MKNLNQKKKREKATSCCENIFFLNVQFFPFRFPQNIPLKENRHLQNVALVSLQEKHVDFGRTQQVVKNLMSFICTCALASSPSLEKDDYSVTSH